MDSFDSKDAPPAVFAFTTVVNTLDPATVLGSVNAVSYTHLTLPTTPNE